ncbi:MAG: thermonuclease family protein [Pseudomonadota bacterium]|nr:thermonuclease family protein [Pseudomonadota bacterium]
MGNFRFRRAGERHVRRKRARFVKSALLVVLLAVAGALLDPAIVPPMGPTAGRPERIEARFTRCGRGRSMACVVDGDTFRLGQRRVRLVGIDAPELKGAKCAAERALGERAADRLLFLVNQGGFELVGHRFHDRDSHGRDLRVARRDGVSLGDQLVDEGLAEHYVGAKQDWCS